MERKFTPETTMSEIAEVVAEKCAEKTEQAASQFGTPDIHDCYCYVHDVVEKVFPEKLTITEGNWDIILLAGGYLSQNPRSKDIPIFKVKRKKIAGDMIKKLNWNHFRVGYYVIGVEPVAGMKDTTLQDLMDAHNAAIKERDEYADSRMKTVKQFLAELNLTPAQVQEIASFGRTYWKELYELEEAELNQPKA